MKFIVLVLGLFASSISLASYRAFDCRVTSLTATNVSGLEHVNLKSSSKLVFVQKPHMSSLQLGDLYLDTLEGASLVVKSSLATASLVEYSFYVDGSLEYEMNINVYNLKTDLFWWGLGEKMKIAELACSVNN